MITFQRNHKELVWYQEYVYQNGKLIGDIFTNITGTGYHVRVYNDLQLACGNLTQILRTIATFASVPDAKEYLSTVGPWQVIV